MHFLYFYPLFKTIAWADARSFLVALVLRRTSLYSACAITWANVTLNGMKFGSSVHCTGNRRVLFTIFLNKKVNFKGLKLPAFVYLLGLAIWCSSSIYPT